MTTKRKDYLDELIENFVGGDPKRQAMLDEETVNFESAQLVYELRTKAGLTQRQLAKKVGTTASVICRMEQADSSCGSDQPSDSEDRKGMKRVPLSCRPRETVDGSPLLRFKAAIASELQRSAVLSNRPHDVVGSACRNFGFDFQSDPNRRSNEPDEMCNDFVRNPAGIAPDPRRIENNRAVIPMGLRRWNRPGGRRRPRRGAVGAGWR